MQYPHCDSNILHAPGVCVYCDRHPDWQQGRIKANMNFTGEDFPGKLPCPAEHNRGRDIINKWGGNQPMTVELLAIYKAENEKLYEEITKAMLEEIPDDDI